MTKPFLNLPLEILDSGFTLPMLLVMIWLHRRADWATGIVPWASSQIIHRHMTDPEQPEYSVRTFRDAMLNLKNYSWISYSASGKQPFPVTIHNYVARMGASKGKPMNPKESTQYRDIQFHDASNDANNNADTVPAKTASTSGDGASSSASKEERLTPNNQHDTEIVSQYGASTIARSGASSSATNQESIYQETMYQESPPASGLSASQVDVHEDLTPNSIKDRALTDEERTCLQRGDIQGAIALISDSVDMPETLPHNPDASVSSLPGMSQALWNEWMDLTVPFLNRQLDLAGLQRLLDIHKIIFATTKAEYQQAKASGAKNIAELWEELQDGYGMRRDIKDLIRAEKHRLHRLAQESRQRQVKIAEQKLPVPSEKATTLAQAFCATHSTEYTVADARRLEAMAQQYDAEECKAAFQWMVGHKFWGDKTTRFFAAKAKDGKFWFVELMEGYRRSQKLNAKRTPEDPPATGRFLGTEVTI